MEGLGGDIICDTGHSQNYKNSRGGGRAQGGGGTNIWREMANHLWTLNSELFKIPNLTLVNRGMGGPPHPGVFPQKNLWPIFLK